MKFKRKAAKRWKKNRILWKKNDISKWLTFRACNDGAALIGPFLDLAVLSDGLGKRADLEETHEHRVVAGAVEARLVGDDPVTFVVVLEHVITSCNPSQKNWLIFESFDFNIKQETIPDSGSSSETGAVSKKIRSWKQINSCVSTSFTIEAN